MALGGQQANVDLMADLTGLTHDIFINDVEDNVTRTSICAAVFKKASPGKYRLEGSAMKFAADFRFKTGAMATSGYLPNYQGLDPVQGSLSPIRRYITLAIDNFVEQAASGPGAFEDLGTRVVTKLWDAWEGMEIRHSIGAASGLIAKISSRTSSTVVVLKDGYGHAGTNPIMHLAEGSIIAWFDVSESRIGGAATITNTGINYSTNAITLDSAATWEPDSGYTVAANDLIYFATMPNKTGDRFEAERNLAPNGIGTILDPDGLATTVFGISEATYERSKPYRVGSGTFDHMEVAEHWLQFASKSGLDVTPGSHLAVCHGSVAAQLARSLMALQQQAYTGEQLRGGYGLAGAAGTQDDMPHSGLSVSGVPVYIDRYFYHDVLATLNRDKLYRINLGQDADFWTGDGSKWSRIEGYDGKDAFVGHYMNFFSPNRGAHAALTGIVTELTDTAYDPVPNY